MSVSKLIVASFPYLLQGAGNTVLLWAGSAVGSIVLGLAVALMRLSGFRLLDRVARAYLSAFRGTPLLIQLLIFYNGLTNYHILLTPLQAAFLGLILHFGAYNSEIFRAAITAVDKGQWEAAAALGMSTAQTLYRIVLPQALRHALPPLGNSLVDLVKSTSVASFIQVSELSRRADEISAGALVIMPLLLVAAAMYWLMTAALSLVQERIERAAALPGNVVQLHK
ncbi:MAG: amino acid ABC transporter permease [Mycobacterium leprae]